MPVQADQLKAELIEEVARRVRASLKAGADSVERFVRRAYDCVAPELLLE
jgi:hypothetical protein